jgi:hypothetical protein
MKHYFVPRDGYWSTLELYSPLDGVINVIRHEWAGDQFEIGSVQYCDFAVVIFHINTTGRNFVTGQRLSAGDLLGTHIGPQTYSDVAVRQYSSNTLHSYFMAISDAVFERYKQIGVLSRDQMIITAEQRDQDPLTPCPNGTLPSSGHIPNWVTFDKASGVPHRGVQLKNNNT